MANPYPRTLSRAPSVQRYKDELKGKTAAGNMEEFSDTSIPPPLPEPENIYETPSSTSTVTLHQPQPQASSSRYPVSSIIDDMAQKTKKETSQVEQLQDTIRRLEGRLEQLEKESRPPSRASIPSRNSSRQSSHTPQRPY